MLEAARVIWTVALAALILALLLTRTYRKLPVFTAYLLATALQACVHWSNMDLKGEWWIGWTEALFTLKAASMCEAFWHRGAGMRRRPLWLLALAVIAGGATFLWGRVRSVA